LLGKLSVVWRHMKGREGEGQEEGEVEEDVRRGEGRR
jgi:hypothetical protein